MSPTEPQEEIVELQLEAQFEQMGVFQVYTGSGTGSGFLIDSKHLVTNCHVVAPFREVAIEMRDRSRVLGKVRRLNPYRDLAVVELVRDVSEQVLELGDSTQLRAKQRLHILGFPVGLPLSLTEGVISNSNQLLDDQYYVQTDAAINPGNSGGPMLDDQKRIIAVTTCKLTQADNVGFGIPVADVHGFIQAFREQSEHFGVECSACNELIARKQRYCPSCGLDLKGKNDFDEYFDDPEPHPIVEFVENALKQSKVDPVLARHGNQNWSFHAGSAPIKIWCCCSEHLNVSSSMVLIGPKPSTQSGRQKLNLNEMFRFLLSDQHNPYFFDIYGSAVRMSLVVSIADVFDQNAHATLTSRVQGFIEKADQVDDLLVNHYGCQPAPETQTDQLQGH